MKNYYNLLYIPAGPFILWAFVRVFWLLTGGTWTAPNAVSAFALLFGLCLGLGICLMREEQLK